MVAVVELLMEAIMARKTERPALVMNDEQLARLQALAGSRTAAVREVQRARVLLDYVQGAPLLQIAREVGVSRPTVYKCIDKALHMGVEAALRDTPRPGRKPEIAQDAKAWVVSLACRKPKDLGLAAELWTLSALAKHVRKEAVAAGWPRLAGVEKMTVWRILNEHELKPHRIRYYLEKRDPDFDRKMSEVLMVYRQVSLQATDPESSAAGPRSTASASTRSPAFRHWGPAPPTCLRSLDSIRNSPGTMNMSVTAPCLFSPRSTCIAERSLPMSSRDIGVGSSSHFCNAWTRTIRKGRRSVSSLTITLRIPRARRAAIWPLDPDGSSMCIPPSMPHG